MLAFLHTAAVHVPTFTGIVRDIAPRVPLRHSVRDDLFARALADGRVTEGTRLDTQAEVQRLVAEGARVVLCTCSTLGSAAEETPAVSHARVIRVDRPMAERAVATGRSILLVAATPTAMATAGALLSEAAQGRALPAVRELMCAAAWERFQAGDLSGYAAALASAVDEHARANDVVMLAQASMAPAAALVRRSDVDVLTSPDVGVRAALALLDRSPEALTAPQGTL
jgi:hypothetical protein